MTNDIQFNIILTGYVSVVFHACMGVLQARIEKDHSVDDRAN